MKLSYRKAVNDDANLLIEIYNSSFYDDYVRYGECPGYGKTKSQMEASILRFPKHIIMKDGIPVGVVSLENRGNGQYFLGYHPNISGIGDRHKSIQIYAVNLSGLGKNYISDAFGQGAEYKILYKKMWIQHCRQRDGR